MKEITNTFVKSVRKHENGSPYCPYANKEHRWFSTVFGCSLCSDWSKYQNINGEDPCSFDDFNNCPLFPHKGK